MPHVDWPTLWANLSHFGALDSATQRGTMHQRRFRPILL